MAAEHSLPCLRGYDGSRRYEVTELDSLNRGSKATWQRAAEGNVYRASCKKKLTHKVKQEVPADGVILDQMGCDVSGCVGGKGHQEVRSCYRQCSTCNTDSGERIEITLPSQL